MLVNKFLKKLRKLVKENDNVLPTLEECESALSKKTLGADGFSLGLTVLWLEEDLKSQSKRNRKSRKLLIKWLKSEMRPYADFGSFSPFTSIICDRYFLIRKERLETKSNMKIEKNIIEE